MGKKHKKKKSKSTIDWKLVTVTAIIDLLVSIISGLILKHLF